MHNNKLYNQILLVEDDRPLTFVMKENLERWGYDVKIAHAGGKGLKEALSNKYALIMLDISLPGISGFDIAAQMKEYDMKTPILVITNNYTPANKLESFRRGINIFHEKPINYDLLEAQVKSLLEYHSVKPVVEIGDLYIDIERMLVKKAGKEIKLSPKEFKLLLALASAKGEVLSRQSILGRTFKGVRDLEEGSIDTLVCRARKKLGKYKGKDVIETVHGEGYRLNLLYVNGEEQKVSNI